MTDLTALLAAHKQQSLVVGVDRRRWHFDDEATDHRYAISDGTAIVARTYSPFAKLHIAANDPATVLALIAVAEEMQAQCDACSDGDACTDCGTQTALDRLTEVLNHG